MTGTAAGALPAWDGARAPTHRCDLATAMAVPNGVRLCFGTAAARPDGSAAACLLNSQELSPHAARHLLEQLRTLLAARAAARGPRDPGA
jgi:hypothetical protein